MCVTPADLGKPIAAIVQRCGAPLGVSSIGSQNSLLYWDEGRGISVWFDADQMLARVVQFFTAPPHPSEPYPDWTVTLPFASGARPVAFGEMTRDEARSALAVDADVTTQYGAAYRSSAHDDVVLAFDSNVLRAAFVGERATLVQNGMIEPAFGEIPLDYMSPIPRDAWLRTSGDGPLTTICRVDIDAEGIARKVTVVVASGDAAFDASLQSRIGDARFRPATLAKRPVSGAIFVQVRH